MCPDSISIVDSRTGIGLSNWKGDFSKDREVTVLGFKAADIWRTEKGVGLFGPKHFGFDMDYTPIEDISRT
jgi:hypothetical protein